MKRTSRALLAVLIALLAGAVVLDVAVVPPAEIPVAIFYAVPLLLVANLATPRVALAFALGVVAVYVGASLWRDLSLAVTAPRTLTLALVGSLSYLLALRGHQARMAREEAERERDRARAAHADLQTFLAMVAHDLAGPLTTIGGRVTMALRSAGMSESARSDLGEVAEQARRMERLVRDLLDAGRIGAGQFEVRPRRMDLARLAREVTRSQDTAATGHRFEVSAPERLEGEWDADRIAQALGNLLSNALRYSPKGSVVRVEVAREAGEALVRVSDEGAGLDRSQLERVFNAFARASETKAIPGTGLGLYITSGIVRAHGGRVWAESAGPGRGATFSLSLPLGGASEGALDRGDA